MRRVLILLSAVVLSCTLYAQNIDLFSGNKGISKSNDQFSGFEATFSFSQIESVEVTETERGTFSAITIEGSFPSGEIGSPQLPVLKKMISIPVGATPIVKVKCHSLDEYYLKDYGINTIFPVQPSIRKDQDPRDIPFAYNEKVYSSDEYNSSNIADIVALGTMRGVNVGMLIINPVKYNPVTNTLKIFNDIEVEIIFENGDYKKTNELFKNSYSPYFEPTYSVLFNSGVQRDVYDDYPDLHSTPVRILVIVNRLFEETIQPWLEWKTQKGFFLDVNYTDEIGTTAAAIKTFCHNKYNDGLADGTAPTYIIFVGDTPQIPASQNGTYTGVATDLYYAETTGDYFPEMYYSRMSAQNVQQLENIIEKTLYYEKYQFADPSYLDNVLLIAGWDSYWTSLVGIPQVNYANTYYYNEENGYANVHKFTNPYTGCYENLSNIGFANFTAHCSQTMWSDPNLTTSMVNNLTNVNKYFVAMANCCQSGDFGYGECLGETMIRAYQKGAVGYIGSSPNSVWYDDFYFTVGAYNGGMNPATPTLENTTLGVYDLMFRDTDFNTLCSHVFAGNLAVTYAHVTPGYQTHTSSPRYYWEAYNVLGDGSLMPYNAQANENEVSHMPIVPIGFPTYQVTAVPGSFVAISKDGIVHGVAVADNSGVADVQLNPPITTGGDVDIVVTRNQYIPYITQVSASSMDEPYIVLDSYFLPENADFGKTISINFDLKNVSFEPFDAHNVNVEVTSESSYISIHTENIVLGDIIAGSTYSSENDLIVTIAENVPNEEIIVLNLLITGEYEDETYSWDATIKFPAYAPSLVISEVYIENQYGAKMSYIDPNMGNSLVIKLSNLGKADLDVINLAVSTISQYLNINANTAEFEVLERENTVTSKIPLTTVGNAPQGTPVYFAVRASSGAFSSQELKVIPIKNPLSNFMANGSLTVSYVNFFDSGGKNGNYKNNENLKLTFIPQNEGNKINVNFLMFDTHIADILSIYDGTETTEEFLLGEFSGNDLPPNFEVTNEQGALTFTFKSTTNPPQTGWEAIVFEQIPYYNIFFEIQDETEKLITDAKIIFDGYVLAKNQFDVGLVMPGTYNFTVSKEGYLDIEETVEIIDSDCELILKLSNVSINEIENSRIVYAFPNPFDDVINIGGNSALVNKVYINNMLGQRIREINLDGKSSFSTKDLPKGIFIIIFENFNKEFETFKMVKQ